MSNQLDKVWVYNGSFRLIVGPPMKGGRTYVGRFLPGNTQHPRAYVEFMMTHRNGAQHFERRDLVVMAQGQTAPVAKTQSTMARAEVKIELPKSLLAFPVPQALDFVMQCDDEKQLIAWGEEDMRDEVRAVIITRMKAKGFIPS